MGGCGSSSAMTAAQLHDAVQQVEQRAGELSVLGRYHPSRLVQDDYAVEAQKLGEGASGAKVIKATSRSTGALVAVKRYKLRGLGGGRRRSSALSSEAETMLSLDHPHVVRLLDIYMSEAEVSFVMERLAGGELADRLEAQGAFPEREAGRTAKQMLLALSYVHGKGIVHRDVKPENFMYTSRGGIFLKLIDFGFSKHFEEGEVMGEGMGSLPYIAPEVLSKSYSSASCDMWSLGICVLTLLAGQVPFDISNPRLMENIKNGWYRLPRRVSEQVSPEALDFVRKLLVVDPCARLTAAQALAHPWLRSVLPDDCKCSEPSCGHWPLSRITAGVHSFALAPPRLQAILRMMALTFPPDELCTLQDSFVDLDVLREGSVDLIQALCADSADPKECAKQTATARVLDNQIVSYPLLYTDFLAAMLTCMQPHAQDLALREALRRLRFDSDLVENASFKGVVEVCECSSDGTPKADSSTRSRNCSYGFAETPLAQALSEQLGGIPAMSPASAMSARGHSASVASSLPDLAEK